MTAAPPAPLRYDGDDVAWPCFRTLAWYEGDWSAPAMASLASDLAGWFYRSHGSAVGMIATASDRLPGRPRPPAPGVLADVGAWIKDSAKDDGSVLRMFGTDGEDDDVERLPFLQIAADSGVVMAEIALPFDTPDLVAQADALAALLHKPGLIAAVQGMGYLLPPANAALSAVQPMATARYLAALELPLGDPVDGLLAELLAFYWEDHPDLKPGLPDIGWRTMLGAGLAARAGKLPDMPGVTVTKEPLTLTAGPAPIWGDVNRGEDISAYRAVAAALAPLAMPREITDSRYFAGDPDDADHMDRLDAYLARFDG